MLRSVRFAARLGLNRTRDSLSHPSHECSRPAHRCRASPATSQSAILTEGGARRGFEWLDELGLLEVLLPEVARMKGVPATTRVSPGGRCLDAHPDHARQFAQIRPPRSRSECSTPRCRQAADVSCGRYESASMAMSKRESRSHIES